jgi:Flp pilus assembly pilin Flp
MTRLRTATRRGDERGVAVVEMALLGTLVFGLLVQLLVMLATAQRAVFAATAAAREVGRAVVLADGEDAANARAATVLAQVERNHGMAAGALHPSIDGAVVRGGIVTIAVRTQVPLLRLPGVGAVFPGFALPVEATYRARVDQYRRFDDAR